MRLAPVNALLMAHAAPLGPDAIPTDPSAVGLGLGPPVAMAMLKAVAPLPVAIAIAIALVPVNVPLSVIVVLLRAVVSAHLLVARAPASLLDTAVAIVSLAVLNALLIPQLAMAGPAMVTESTAGPGLGLGAELPANPVARVAPLLVVNAHAVLAEIVALSVAAN